MTFKEMLEALKDVDPDLVDEVDIVQPTGCALEVRSVYILDRTLYIDAGDAAPEAIELFQAPRPTRGKVEP